MAIGVVEFDFEKKTERTVGPEEIRTTAAQPGLYYWVDSDGLDPHGDRRVMERLGIGQETVENVFGPDKDGRYDVHRECLHFAVTECRLREGRVARSHVDVVLGAGFILTYHRGEVSFLSRMKATYGEDFARFSQSPGFLLYEIGDHLIEVSRETLREVSGAVAQVQRSLFGEMDEKVFADVVALTNDTLGLLSTALAQRDLMHELASRRSAFVAATTQPFLQQIADRFERLGNDFSTQRQVLSETLNLYIGLMSYKTNKVVNRLTVLSMIFLPLGFLCGVYGMNLKGIPEMEWSNGYLFFWALVLLVIGATTVWMRRQRWV